MDLIIGSSIIRSTNGVIMVEETQQLSFEWGQAHGDLLLTMNLYNRVGKHVASLRRNDWTFNDHDQFVLTTKPKALKLVDTRTARIALEARIVTEDRVEISDGVFFSQEGHKVEITAAYCRIEGSLSRGEPVEGAGGTVQIG
jgi:hypothetical protein